jgi:hypothetical protein
LPNAQAWRKITSFRAAISPRAEEGRVGTRQGDVVADLAFQGNVRDQTPVPTGSPTFAASERQAGAGAAHDAVGIPGG